MRTKSPLLNHRIKGWICLTTLFLLVAGDTNTTAQTGEPTAIIQKGLLYRDVVVKVLTDEHATKDEILDGLDWIRKETTSKDVAMVLFAGHGLNDQANANHCQAKHRAGFSNCGEG